jgi:hypothetical protein
MEGRTRTRPRRSGDWIYLRWQPNKVNDSGIIWWLRTGNARARLGEARMLNVQLAMCLKLLAVTTAAAACVSTATAVTSCSDQSDCQYNGGCINGRCHCYPGWRGTGCGWLNLGIAAPVNGLRQAATRTSTWGGSIQKAATAGGVHYMLAAEIVNECGVHDYKTNSRAALAVSTTGAEGPYARLRTAIPVETHNIQTVIAPDGSVLAFVLGDGRQHAPIVDCALPPAPAPPAPPPPPLPPPPLAPTCGGVGWSGEACTANITIFHAHNITADFAPFAIQLKILAGVGAYLSCYPFAPFVIQLRILAGVGGAHLSCYTFTPFAIH